MPDIDVKAAVKRALEYVREIFEEEKLRNLGLEEVERVEDVWIVTVGFSRPWDFPQPNPLHPLSSLGPMKGRPQRDYKEVRLRASDGEVLSVKNRE